MFRRALVSIIVLAALLGTVAPARALSPWGDRAGPAAQQRERDISASAAARRVRERVGGRILAVHRERQGERLIYRVKVLTGDGHVREIRVDARTGRILD